MFTGLSAFPLTPFAHDAVDTASFAQIIDRLSAAGVDSITALGSTGSYAYMTAEERAQVAQVAVDRAGATPVIIGIGALRTTHVLDNVESAHRAGAHGLLLAPMTYQPLTGDDVYELFKTVSEHTDLPVIVYDNPGTTHFTFTTDLYGRIAELENIASIKIPGVPADPAAAVAHVRDIRAVVPSHVTIGVSGDADAATGLNAGCDAWYSVIGGTLPKPALDITRAALSAEPEAATAASRRLQPLWDLFSTFGGSLRVVAAIAEHLGLAHPGSLPLPIQGLTDDQRRRVVEAVSALGLDA